MRIRSIVGVLVGGVVDIVATNVLVFPVLIVAAMRVDVAHTVPGQVGPALLATLRGSPGLYGTAMIAGALASVLGGYAGAAIVGSRFRVAGACTAYLCVGSGVYAILVGRTAGIPMWEILLLMPVSPLLGTLGGWLRERRAERVPPAPMAPSPA